MRIIAKKKDYYDCIQAYGQDHTLLYVRIPEEVQLKQREWSFPSLFSSWWFSSTEATQHIIGFCGKIYPMLEMHGHIRDVRISKKCFTIEEVDAFIKTNVNERRDNYFGKTGRRWWRGYGKQRSEFVKFFEHCKKKKNSYAEMFIDKHCPVFVATYNRTSRIVYNAILRPYDFVRIVDPYTAFQEISMFMGSMAVPERDMPVIPDDLKIHSRGFTDQSFRAPFRDDKRVPK